jgi:YggT family protein
MGDASLAFAGLLLDAVSSAQHFVQVFIGVYTLLIFVYILMSWFRTGYSTNAFVRFLHDVCDPYLRIFRRVLPPLGPIDLSPVVAIVCLWLIERLVNQVILASFD